MTAEEEQAIKDWDADRASMGKKAGAEMKPEIRHLDLFDARAAAAGPGYMKPKRHYRRSF